MKKAPTVHSHKLHTPTEFLPYTPKPRARLPQPLPALRNLHPKPNLLEGHTPELQAVKSGVWGLGCKV